jgi:hypothetical protein
MVNNGMLLAARASGAQLRSNQPTTADQHTKHALLLAVGSNRLALQKQQPGAPLLPRA